MDEAEAWEAERVKITRPGPGGPMRLEMTCMACPTQYDIFLADGRYLYFRARHSQWYLEMYPSKDGEFGDPILATADRFDEPEADNGSMDDWQVLQIIDEWLPKFLEHWDDVRAKLGR